jgi:hypothetical protein
VAGAAAGCQQQLVWLPAVVTVCGSDLIMHILHVFHNTTQP